MDSSYRRFNNIGDEEGATSHKIPNGADPLQFEASSDPNYFVPTVPENIIVRPATTPQAKLNNDQNQTSMPKQRLRLRALETETEYFLRLLNVTTIKRLLWAQMTACCVILVTQVLLYAIASNGYFKVVDYTGIGIWAPLFIFSVGSGLALMAVKSPAGCILGTAMGFQIASASFAVILTLLASISLLTHGRWDYHDDVYDPEVGGRIICSFMIFSSMVVFITCVFVSIQFCRATCCGRSRASEAFLFDVETVKI
ncbi:uncharacterized protein LOC110843805 [Folsomia candida]|uniref:uncharacterized protein LOC110843805 n=1 Tax=Folsomia candida TaxID=158441 RepID=UPI000B8F39CB|nr:uncharacterized protein LOC110843805 [Folsomia candida]XP_021945539.1 uncharacterized protein LOC110843805 [Folsomia candida]